MARKTLRFLDAGPFPNWEWKARMLCGARELGSDVDDERGASGGEGGRVKNFVRAERFAGDGELFEAGEETTLRSREWRRCSDRDGGLPSRE